MQTYLTAGSYTQYEFTDGKLFGKFVTLPDELFERHQKVKLEWEQVQRELSLLYSGEKK